MDHPFFAVTKADGTYSFPQKLVPGKYTISAWHENKKFKSKDVEIEVKDGDVSADFSFTK